MPLKWLVKPRQQLLERECSARVWVNASIEERVPGLSPFPLLLSNTASELVYLLSAVDFVGLNAFIYFRLFGEIVGTNTCFFFFLV